MSEPALLLSAIDKASSVVNTPFFTTVLDKLCGFRISKWAAEGEVRKKLIHDEYLKAKENGIVGMQYIEYMRRTTNLLDTATKTTKYIDQNKSNDIEFENDFFWNTIEHAKTISDEDVQELVAKILAGEYNEPGSYSMSLLQTLKMLGKYEIKLFERICSLCVDTGLIPQIVFSRPESIEPIMKSLGIDFGSLQELQNLGLFLPNGMSSTTDNPEKGMFIIDYFDKELKFKPTHETDFNITFPGYYGLSKTGAQIIKHLQPEYKEEYYTWLKSNFKINNYKLIED
jgi:hypothetical protein